MKTDGVNQLPDFHVRDGSNVYWQVKHVLVRHIPRVNIVEGRSKPVLLLEGRQAHPNHPH